MKDRRLVLCFLVMILAFSAAAQTVEAVAVQDEKLASDATQVLSEFIVSGCLDSLFGAGYIGTNKRPSVGTRAVFDAMQPGQDAIEGFVDFQLFVFLTYSAGELIMPPDAFYKLVRVSDGVVLGEGMLKAFAPASQASADIENACTAMGKSIVSPCLAWLKE